MPELEFNDAERYLLENWQVATEVEDSMSEVRDKYQALCERISEAVRENHKELDLEIVEVLSVAKAGVKSGAIILGRSSWPSEGKNWPTGFWVENLRLEVLLDQEQDPPMVGFWLISDDDVDVQAFGRAVKDAAKDAFSAEQLSRWHLGDNDETAFVGRVVARKEEVLTMLSKGETERFVYTIV